jgi:hypothetical protein
MLNRSRGFLAIALFVFGAAVIAWAGIYSPSFQKCNTGYESSNPQNPTSDSDQPIVTLGRSERLWRFAHCEGVFLDENSAAITAIATLAIAAFTLTLWLATGKQVEITGSLAELTDREFIATHRPRMIVHFIRRHDIPEDEFVGAEFKITNVGTGDVWVTTSQTKLARFFPGQWPHPDELNGQDLIAKDADGRRHYAVGKGDWLITHAELDTEGIVIQGMADSGREGNDRLYLLGWIRYVDALGNPLWTYFCREYSHETRRFIPAKNCDWEEANG